MDLGSLLNPSPESLISAASFFDNSENLNHDDARASRRDIANVKGSASTLVADQRPTAPADRDHDMYEHNQEHQVHPTARTQPTAAPIPSFLLRKRERALTASSSLSSSSAAAGSASAHANGGPPAAPPNRQSASMWPTSPSRQSGSSLVGPGHHGHSTDVAAAPLAAVGPMPPSALGPIAPPPPLLADELLRTTILWRAFAGSLDSIKAESGSDESLDRYSAQHVSWVFNSREQNYRNQLWADWTIYQTLWEKLGVRAFPISERKVTLLVSQFVDLPCSASLRHAYGSVTTAQNVNLHRAESMLNTLKLAGQATLHLWPRVRSFHEADSDRFETLREVWQRIPWFKCVGSTRSSGRRTYPELISSGSARSPSIRMPKKTRLPKTVSVKRERSTTYDLHLSADEPRTGRIDQHAMSFEEGEKTRRLTRDEPRAQSLILSSAITSISDGMFELIPFPRLLVDLPMVTQDLRILRPDPALNHLGHGRLQTALAHEDSAQIDTRYSIRRIWMFYADLSARFPMPEFPITPIKLALFAFAYTPGPIRATFDQISHYEHVRQFPAFEDSHSFIKALETLEATQRLTRDLGEVHAYENAQWLMWKNAFINDMLTVTTKSPRSTDSGGSMDGVSSSNSSNADTSKSNSLSSNSSAPSSSSSTGNGNGKAGRPRLPSAAPLLNKPAASRSHQVPMKRGRSFSDHSDTWSEHSDAPLTSAGTGSANANGAIAGSHRRPGRPRKQRTQTITPPPQPWKPEKLGELPEDRRPPPLPPVFPHPFASMFAGDEADALQGRSVALHRPKRIVGLKMIPLANLAILA
ncbi:BZ3500_MvSof-1268-A1-R1_Chr4-2g07151 [Microbotryum saponariae]|uniref:BZ3500_MvSof-1268-A1-R1_Chr4-2g07151 protein n=1 Tax=Microbotryum saponariae TaxID=289078 RepID=A0A2X0MX55_9BASI|nr:BZ3500_MvSof-1268-A1-R1_Chr4-2g07151 [Microbotryum saponariae]SDA06816.1 BZ3501_MvSof-1269-A2-R1_Chr4-2g06862 [Microbotryum saponariae]